MRDGHVRRWLDAALRRGGWVRGVRRAEAVVAWPRIVGADVARFATAVAYQQGTLVVEVADAETSLHLGLQRQRILDAYRERLGDPPVRDLRFRVGRPTPPPPPPDRPPPARYRSADRPRPFPTRRPMRRAAARYRAPEARWVTAPRPAPDARRPRSGASSRRSAATRHGRRPAAGRWSRAARRSPRRCAGQAGWCAAAAAGAGRPRRVRDRGNATAARPPRR